LSNERVLIAGAGPVGLVAGAHLARSGVPVTVFEEGRDLSVESRASTFHPPTLDMLDRFAVVGQMIEQGLICPTWQFRDRTEGVIAAFELSRLSPETKHPYRLQCEQWRLGEMLHARLERNRSATIRLGTKAIDATRPATVSSFTCSYQTAAPRYSPARF
jgi:3-(3-hydroxy-phenyl)propionate hydroxylase